MRIRLDLAYDGSAFAGWAAQPGRRTVEGELSTALGTVLRTEPPRLTVGGRTDAGVHARGSVCHLDVTDEVWRQVPGRSERSPAQALTLRLSGVLASDVTVRRVRVVPEAFDARFSALRRRYSYRICDDPAARDPMRRGETVWRRRGLDVTAMDRAGASLTGLHDFAAFCKRRPGATTIRELQQFSWARGEDGTVVASVVADAFCRSMVRALVGVVVPVGEGHRDEDWPRRVRETGRREPSVSVMPAHGLCLDEIVYPPDEELAAQAQRARTARLLSARTSAGTDAHTGERRLRA